MTKSEILNRLNVSYSLNLTHVKLIHKGGCISYCASNKMENYFLKIIPFSFMDTAKQSIDILIYLQEIKFPSPTLIFTNDGAPYLEQTEKNSNTLWVLFEFIEGSEPKEGEDLERIGELIGQLHDLMKDYKGSLSVHGKEFFIDRYIKLLQMKQYDELKLQMFREYGDILWKRVENLPQGFCHGDMHRGNLLKTASGNYFLLDFDTSCFAFGMYDIMIMCNSTPYFNYEEGGYQKAKHTYDTFLKGYTKYRTLSEYEYRAFYDLIAIYHYQLQATIIEIHGLDCVDEDFLDTQLDWLLKWEAQRNI